jgi:hypothetical protein
MFASHLIVVIGFSFGQVQPSLSPAEVAQQLLDDTVPADKRRPLAEANAGRAAEVVAALVAGLPADDPAEEYRRIPWIWRVSVAAGKKNEAEPLRALLDVSLPKEGEKLRDWQAVVIGGGIVNGISLSGPWPGPRIDELLGQDEALRRRWQAALTAAAAMADDAKVKTGTRYDALRMIALDPAGPQLKQLTRYLKDANAELQMGAVSGLGDIDDPQATKLLAATLPDLTPANRTLAIDALLRSEERVKVLRGLLDNGKLAKDSLSATQRQKLEAADR